jgi:TolA-binding protein
LPLLAPLVLATGCADSTTDALRQDVALIRQDVNALKASAQRARTETDTINQLDRRSRDQTAETNRQISALSTRIESMSSELNRMSSRLDDVSRRLDTVSRQAAQPRAPAPPPPGTPSGAPVTPPSPPTTARPMPPVPPTVVPPGPPASPPSAQVSPPAAIAPPFAAPRPAAPPPGVPAPPVGVGPPPIASAPGTPAPSTVPPTRPAPPAGRSVAALSAEDSYQAAYLDFSRGRYELAMSGFRDFLRRHPDSPLADSAQYGIGESYYSMATAAAAQGQTDKATQALEQSVQEFRKVMVIYPRGAKVPPALYKEALALAELKQTGLARARLQYLVDNFPQSEEAPLAKERLSSLK